MGCCSFITKPFKKVVGGLFGSDGGNSSNVSTSTSTTVNPVTNVTNKIDLEPVAKILAKSQEQNAKATKDAAALKLINDERNRQLKAQQFKQIDTYLEHAKNGLILSGVVVGLLYVSKKSKRRK